MKKHTKLFEEFSQREGVWAVMFHPDSTMYGLYNTEQEALSAKQDIRDYIEDGYEDEDMIDVQQVFPGSSDEEDARLFYYAMNSDLGGGDPTWPGMPTSVMVRRLIELGGNPFSQDPDEYYGPSFEDPEQIEDLYKKHKPREIVWKRQNKSKKLFGI